MQVSSVVHTRVEVHRINSEMCVLRLRKVNLVSFYFLSHFHFYFNLFSIFLFLELKVRVKTHEHKKKDIKE